MELAIISPTKYLELFCKYRDNDYHMALAQRILEDGAYSDFYKKERGRRATIIMDNGACELGKSIGGNLLIQAVKEINPQVLVLPDSLKDGDETIRLSSKFIDNYLPHLQNIKLIGVVQGKSKEEWLNTLNYFMENKHVSIIGISDTSAVDKNGEHKFPRYELIKHLASRGLVGKNKKVHILGLNSSGHLELEKLSEFEFIEGADSSAPVVHGAYGIKFYADKPYEKIRSYLDPDITLDKKQIDLVVNNLKVMYEKL